MKKLYRTCLVITILVGSVSIGYGKTAMEIMQKSLERDDGETMLARVMISSCRTTRKGERITCAENPRVKLLEEVRKDYGKDGQDTKQVIIIREPAREKGIGFLQYDYGEVGKENDQWMYLSAFGKVKRVVPGNEDKPKTGSFFGTEMNYEDVEKRRLLDYTYHLLPEEVYRNRECNVVESIPTSEYGRKSNYSKIYDWIDKENDVRLKTILFDRQGRAIKQITKLNIENICGIWSWRIQVVTNLKTPRITILKIVDLAYNFPVADEYFTQRALIDASFREKHLSQYRTYLNNGSN